MYAADHLQLQANPFTASTSGARIGRPLQAALGEVIRQIGLEAPVVVVCGNAGTGKTLLMNMIARACTDMGLCARQIVRGDLMHVVFGQSSDVLLIDEADSITDSTLHALVSAGVNTSTTTMIFLCRPSNVRRFTSSGGRAVIIELAPLMHSDARNYLLERATSAGRPDLFEVDALDLLIDGSRGSPRALRSIASLAFFAAAVDGSSRIGPKHVADALASQIYFEAPKSDQTPIPTTSRGEVPIPAPMIAGPIKASSPAPAFAAAADGSSRIGPKHVADALASQIYFETPKSDQTPIPTTSRGEVPIPAPMIAGPIKASSPAPAFAAPVDGSPRIGPKHVADALASQIYFETPKSDQTPIPTTSRREVPIPAPMIAGPIKASSPAPAFAAPVDGSPRIGPKHVADALASQIYFEAPKSDQATIPTPSRGEVPIPAPMIAEPIKASSPAPVLAETAFAAAGDSSSRIAPKHVADASAPQIYFEAPKSDQATIPTPSRAEVPIPAPMIAEPIKASSPAPVLAESAFAAAVDRSPRIGPRRVADALASQIYFEAPKSDQTTIPTTPHGEVPIPAPMIAGPVKASSPAPVLAQPASDLIPFGSVAEARKKFGAARPRSAVWIPRLVGVTTALAASIAIAEGLPSRLFNSIPGSANIFNGPPGEARAVPRLGFVSFVPRPPAVPPRDASNKAETAKQTADIAKALKEASTNEAKPVASAVPARKATTEQAQAIKKPVAKGPSDISNLSKPAKDSAERAALAPLKETASPPAAFQELAYPAPAPKEVAALTEELKQEESPQAAAAQVLAVLPPAAKQKETDDRAKAEEMALARAREAVLAKVAADRAQAAKQAEERAWAARQAAMRVLSNSLLGIRN